MSLKNECVFQLMFSIHIRSSLLHGLYSIGVHYDNGRMLKNIIVKTTLAGFSGKHVYHLIQPNLFLLTISLLFWSYLNNCSLCCGKKRNSHWVYVWSLIFTVAVYHSIEHCLRCECLNGVLWGEVVLILTQMNDIIGLWISHEILLCMYMHAF